MKTVITKGSYRTPDQKAQIEWELTQGENGPEFSACGEFDGGAGQCLDRIGQAYPGDSRVQEIVGVWSLYHLNGTRAGLPEQEQALAEWRAAGNGGDYTAACNYLDSIGLLVVPIPEGAKALGGFAEGATEYEYGTRWIYSEIPGEVIDKIKSWGDNSQTSRPLHIDQAEQFLTDTGTTLEFKPGDKKPTWPAIPKPTRLGCNFITHVEEISLTHGRHWIVTIKNPRGSLTIDYWESIVDRVADAITGGAFRDYGHREQARERAQAALNSRKVSKWRPTKGNPPTAYSVLTCLATYTPVDFAEFCSEHGYSADSIKEKRTARDTWQECARQTLALRQMFSSDEMERLQEIQ